MVDRVSPEHVFLIVFGAVFVAVNVITYLCFIVARREDALRAALRDSESFGVEQAELQTWAGTNGKVNEGEFIP